MSGWLCVWLAGWLVVCLAGDQSLVCVGGWLVGWLSVCLAGCVYRAEDGVPRSWTLCQKGNESQCVTLSVALLC